MIRIDLGTLAYVNLSDNFVCFRETNSHIYGLYHYIDIWKQWVYTS